MFFRLMMLAYSQVRITKCELIKRVVKNTKNTGQHLIKALKKIYRSKLADTIWMIKEYGNTSRTLSKVENLIWKIWSRDNIKLKKDGLMGLRSNILRV